MRRLGRVRCSDWCGDRGLEKYKALSEREQLLFLTVLRDIESQLEYIKYPEDMKQIQTNAQQLMTFSIFSDKEQLYI